MSKILVTGGAGYIGSHTVRSLNNSGYETIVYDNLSTGHIEAILPPATFVHGDLNETEKLDTLMQKNNFSSIIHFAASIVVPESIVNPLKYYQNNTINTTNLISLAIKHNVQYFIFSSTAAVYGIPSSIPVPESEPTNPINPYGRSKLMSEFILQDCAKVSPQLKYVILRYFNVAGADPDNILGQSTPEATHLIKVACKTALGKYKYLPIYGTDYPTPDGTGIRDYIHVTDLADVHVLALQYLEKGNNSDIFNCGYGHGYSVNQIIEALQRTIKKKINTQPTERRAGDSAELVADPSKIKNIFGWLPKYDNIDKIVYTAYLWEKHPKY